MKLLSIRIPLAPPGETIPDEQQPAMKRAAYEELCTLIPRLDALKNTAPGLGIKADRDQLFLAVMLLPLPQLSLKLSEQDWMLGRIVECDPAVLDQDAVRTSVLLTRELLAAAGAGEPEAIKEWLERLGRRGRSRAANRLRRDLGKRYEVEVFGQPEVVMLPGVEATRLEREDRMLSVVVTEMKGCDSFRATNLVELRDDDKPAFIFDPRQVWTFVRGGTARTFSVGQLIHESMEQREPVRVKGKLVIHELTRSPVAMEVDVVEAAIDPASDIHWAANQTVSG
jgi:hypothetical protein